MPHQSNLFSGDAPGATASPAPHPLASGPGLALTALKFTDSALSPEQLRFNKLLTRTENLGRKIEAMRDLADTHRPLHGATLHPLEIERRDLMRDMALWLDERLGRKGLTAKQGHMASEIICGLTAALAMAGDEAMQQLHDAHSDQSLAEQEQSAVADMQGLMEELTGQPMGADEQGFASVEEMLRARLKQMQEQARAEDEAQATHKARGKKSARQQQVEQQAQDADGALRTIYRQLVSALHPDRESDAHERARKTALMKDVNAAYERRDLLTLLQLQLRAEVADGEMVSNLARDKVAALTRLLKDRAEVLTRELREIEMHTMVEFALSPYAPVSAASLKRALVEQQRHLQADIAMMKRDMLRVQDDAAFKRWLRDQHEASQENFNPFELPGYV